MGKDTLVCNANSFNIIPKSVKHLSEITWENGLKSMNRTISNNGKYWASGTNNCGTITDSIQVEFLNAPVADAPADLSFCDIVNPIPTLTAKASGGAATYAWNNGDLGLTTLANNGGTYVITGVNACGKTTDSTRIVVHPSPLPNLGIDTAFCGTFAYPLNAGNGWKQVIWSNGSSSPAIVANNFGQYRVTVTDINGCSGSDEITIGSNCKLIWYIPTAFTPNNDGRNDLFTPTIKDVQDLHMKIYDRWGSQVWDNKGQTNAWDGNINGNLAPEGVYIWRAEFRSNFKPYYKEGTVTLMR
jgi:gliding motility-associated-like protein